MKEFSSSEYAIDDKLSRFTWMPALYKRGRLPGNRLLSDHLRLEQINEGFDRLNEGKAIRQVVMG